MKFSVNKREKITYIVMVMWVLMGVNAEYFNVSLVDLSAYFISFTGFIGVYVWSETVRNSAKNTGRLPQSKREKMIYWCTLLWFLVGMGAISFGIDLTGVATYFGALTPFIGAYMIGVTKNNQDGHYTNQETPLDETQTTVVEPPLEIEEGASEATEEK